MTKTGTAFFSKSPHQSRAGKTHVISSRCACSGTGRLKSNSNRPRYSEKWGQPPAPHFIIKLFSPLETRLLSSNGDKPATPASPRELCPVGSLLLSLWGFTPREAFYFWILICHFAFIFAFLFLSASNIKNPSCAFCLSSFNFSSL